MSNRARTPTTPFIPPFGTPQGSPAPVVPGSLRHSPNPANHAAQEYLQSPYAHSPYATTPFIPPSSLSPMGTPGVIPAVIPGGLGTSQPRGREGLSHDFVGYPPGADPWSSPNPQGHTPMTPMHAGYGPQPHISPWHQPPPLSAPPGFANFSTPWAQPAAPLPSPWATNGRGMPPGAYSPYSAGFTPGYAPPGQLPGGHGGPPPGWPMQGMHPQMHPQMAAQQHQGYFGGHPGGPPGGPPDWLQQAAMHERGGGFGERGFERGFGERGFAPPNMGPPPRLGPDLQTQRNDRMPAFSVGPHYGPVLEANMVHILGVQIKMNPLLMPLPEDGSDQVHLDWNMLFPTSDVHRSSDPSHISWSKGRDEPATFPRISSLSIVSESMPWMITVHATEKNRGITCGEIIDTIGRNLSRLTSRADYDNLPPQAKRDLTQAYQYNRQRNPGVPGGLLGQGMKRLDFLGRGTMFAGLEINDRVQRKLHGISLPCTVVLRSSLSYPMTDRERKDQEARQRAGSSQGHRSRANSVNTRIHVQSPSSTGSDGDSADYDHDHGHDRL